MSCRHENPPGYAFCTICGQALAVRRCACGWACGMADSYCGRCGTAFDRPPAASARLPSTPPSGRYDLHVLQELARRRTVEGPQSRGDQPDSRRLVPALPKGQP
jgi:hypothetical protein